MLIITPYLVLLYKRLKFKSLRELNVSSYDFGRLQTLSETRRLLFFMCVHMTSKQLQSSQSLENFR